MTHLHKHKENTKLILRYMAFLDECKTLDSRLKLITEIGRLNEQNKAIDKMPLEETKQNIVEYTIEVTAII